MRHLNLSEKKKKIQNEKKKKKVKEKVQLDFVFTSELWGFFSRNIALSFQIKQIIPES